jgi:hypothetical protein
MNQIGGADKVRLLNILMQLRKVRGGWLRRRVAAWLGVGVLVNVGRAHTPPPLASAFLHPSIRVGEGFFRVHACTLLCAALRCACARGQVCNHPYLFDGAEPGPPFTNGPHLWQASGKMILLDKLLSKLQSSGSRVLLFSQVCIPPPPPVRPRMCRHALALLSESAPCTPGVAALHGAGGNAGSSCAAALVCCSGGGRPAVSVCCVAQMTRLLDVLEDYVSAKGYQYCRIDGNSKGEDRDGQMEEFNRPCVGGTPPRCRNCCAPHRIGFACPRPAGFLPPLSRLLCFTSRPRLALPSGVPAQGLSQVYFPAVHPCGWPGHQPAHRRRRHSV